MLLTLVTPQKKILVDVAIDEVVIPGYRGELTVLEGHAPLITTLDIGLLQYKEKGQSELKKFSISWGYCEVAGEHVKVLAETAEDIKLIDQDRAKNSLKRSEELLSGNDLSQEDSQKHMNKIKKAQIRLGL